MIHPLCAVGARSLLLFVGRRRPARGGHSGPAAWGQKDLVPPGWGPLGHGWQGHGCSPGASEEGWEMLRAWLCVPLGPGTWSRVPSLGRVSLEPRPRVFSCVFAGLTPTWWLTGAHQGPRCCSPAGVQLPRAGQAGIFGVGAVFQRLGGGEVLCGGRAVGFLEL